MFIDNRLGSGKVKKIVIREQVVVVYLVDGGVYTYERKVQPESKDSL